MSENSSHRSSLISVLAVFTLFALFLAVVYYVYVPRRTGTFAGDGVRSSDDRKKTLLELQQKGQSQATTYGWVDQGKGVVQLPLDRAMELTVQQYAAKPQSSQ
jgi:hypothetical protein